MSTACRDFEDFVRSEILEPVERCIEADCIWWCLCCNKWFCFIVWVVTVVVTTVIRTVCEVISTVLTLVLLIIGFVAAIIIFFFTWDPVRLWDAFVDLVAALVSVIFTIIRFLTLGTIIASFRNNADRWNLRAYVRDAIESSPRFTPEQRSAIRAALGIDGNHGFGLRLLMTARRGYVRSDTLGQNGIPILAAAHADTNDATRVDLKILAGFRSTSVWQRHRPNATTLNMRGARSTSVTEQDIDNYLADPTGPDTVHFRIDCMGNSYWTDKKDIATVCSDALGLKLRFTDEEVELTEPRQIRMPSDGLNAVLESPPFNRANLSSDPVRAREEQCRPLVIGTFLFDPPSFNGFATQVFDPPPCEDGTVDRGSGTSGIIFRDRMYDFLYRWVLIHEIGHMLGLCHASGVERIMYTGAGGFGPVTASSFPDYLWLDGGPRFTIEEAKRAWDYILTNFNPECLSRRAFER